MASTVAPGGIVKIFSALLLVGLLACNGREPTPPPPPPPPPGYDPSTLLVDNQSGFVLDFTARCCGDQVFTANLLPSTRICIIMLSVTNVTIEAASIDRVYLRQDSIPNAHSSPAWTWTLLPGDAQLRTATEPCG